MRLERYVVAALVALAALAVGAAHAQAPLRLLVWINGDKG